jgi:hypothetical protein
MGMQLSGLAQLVARLKGHGDESSEPGEAPDSSLRLDAELPPVPAPDPLAEVAQAVAGSRQRLEALAGRLAALRRQTGRRRPLGTPAEPAPGGPTSGR